MNQRKSENSNGANDGATKMHVTDKKEEFKDPENKKLSMTSSQVLNDKKVTTRNFLIFFSIFPFFS
jgi:hypothetical protein